MFNLIKKYFENKRKEKEEAAQRAESYRDFERLGEKLEAAKAELAQKLERNEELKKELENKEREFYYKKF